MNSILWNSKKQSKKFFATDNDSEKRTQILATLMDGLNIDALDLITPIKKCGSTIDAKGTLSYDKKLDYKNYLNGAAVTLRDNPRMLEYKFNENGELETILVHSHVDLLDQFSVGKEEICQKACEVYVAVQLFIDSTYTESEIKPKVTLTGKLSNKCDFDNTEPTNVVSGGSKSRRRHRRHARKTRRGCTRKSKSKTHRRRRHSRARKHKKNTYTRRR
jgi:hypothetical protein